MNGKFDSKQSWEKQQVFKLENGYTAIVSWNNSYGELVTCLTHPKLGTWHACNGLAELPQFAHAWLKCINPTCGCQIVQPKFEREYK